MHRGTTQVSLGIHPVSSDFDVCSGKLLIINFKRSTVLLPYDVVANMSNGRLIVKKKNLLGG